MIPALNPLSHLTQNLSSIITSSLSQSEILYLNSKLSSSISQNTKILMILTGLKKILNIINRSDFDKIFSQIKTKKNLETLKKSNCTGFNLNYRYKTKILKPKTVKNLSSNSKSINDELKKNRFFSDRLLEYLKARSYSCLQPNENIGSRYNKRKARCNHYNEIVSEERYSGILKKYQLKTRYGFIKTQSKKVFLCEDELVLSGVNLRKFKDCIYNKIPIHLEFNLKSFVENGKEILSATQIQIRQDKENLE
ncbi:hypothetical protein SteCoe_24024 [Stentor coeruleus]|uniref:Uncharacterized protein n=1 Tax=Stentor coeruleus TaxID=5963 RepID=A0A1R2BIL0_9CILI|nr:hypothetical protein SteCoe_24024 [Stentor coeruleus]